MSRPGTGCNSAPRAAPGGALASLGAWLVGPSRYALWVRSTCGKRGRWVALQAHGLTSGSGYTVTGPDRSRRAGAWILGHLNGLRIFGLAIAGLFLVFSGNLTGWSLLAVIVLAVYLGLVQLVTAWPVESRRNSRARPLPEKYDVPSAALQVRNGE